MKAILGRGQFAEYQSADVLCVPICRVPVCRLFMCANLPSASLQTFYACQFAEYRSADVLCVPICRVPVCRRFMRANLPSASLPTFYACQFAECRSADVEGLVRASLPTELSIKTQSLTQSPRILTITVKAADHWCWEPLESSRLLNRKQLSESVETGHYQTQLTD